MPTIDDLIGFEPLEVLEGYRQHPIEGETFAASLTDNSAAGRRTQCHPMLGQRSIDHETAALDLSC